MGSPQVNLFLNSRNYEGNTPRFGTVKKVGQLKPIKSRPTKLLANISESIKSEQSLITATFTYDHEKGFESCQEEAGSTSFISTSPTNQSKLEIGSLGNSPKKKISIKHPLISKKSPLFKKFGLDSGCSNQNKNPNMSGVNIYEKCLIENQQIVQIAKSSSLGNRINDAKSRVDLNHMIKKYNEGRKVASLESNQIFDNSMSTTNTTEQPNGIFTFYSSQKMYDAPDELIAPTANLDAYSSELNLNSDPSANLMAPPIMGLINTRSISGRENVSKRNLGVNPQPPPQLGSSLVRGLLNRKKEQVAMKDNSSKMRESKESLNEETPQNVRDSELNKENGKEYRRRRVTTTRKIICNNTSTNMKEVSVNESINSLELSAITYDTNEKDILNISKDDGLLQYIDKEQIEDEGMTADINNIPSQLKRQLISDSNIVNDEKKEDNLALRIKKFENQRIQNNENQQSSTKFSLGLKDPNNSALHIGRLDSHQIHTSFKQELFVKKFISEDNSRNIINKRTYFSNGTHDRNISMFENQRK